MSTGVVENGFQHTLGAGRDATTGVVRELSIDNATGRLRVDALFAGVITVSDMTVLGNVEAVVRAANVGAFAAPIAMTADGVAIFEFVTDTAGIFSIAITRAGTPVTGTVLNGAVVQAGRWQSLEFPVRNADTVNISQSTGPATITAMLTLRTA